MQFNQVGKVLPSYHHAIYLAARTSLDLKEKLAEQVQINPSLIIRIFWENSNGLRVVVDDNMDQHLPEAQIMTADICGISHTEVASLGSNHSSVEVNLVF